jgi:Response regulator containing a CheY-like receiver domain and an HTH DNA-binding domain
MSGDQTATRMNHVSPNRGKNRPVLCDAGFMTSEKVRVVVGDDHPLFRDGVVRALTSSGSIEVVAEADDGYRRSKRSGRIRRRWPCWTTDAGHGRRRGGGRCATRRAADPGATGVGARRVGDRVPRAAGGGGRIPAEGVNKKRTDKRGAGLREGPRRRGAQPGRRPGRGDPQRGPNQQARCSARASGRC